MRSSDRPSGSPLLTRAHEYFRRGPANAEGWSMLIDRHRKSESFYRERWSHDKVVRSTHGVNCTGSCSWNVYVKDGLITWERQATDYPRTDPGRPDHEPRGCPRGASFSWYTYSPARLKHPLVRGSLLERWRAARAAGADPVAAWAQLADDASHFFLRSSRGRTRPAEIASCSASRDVESEAGASTEPGSGDPGDAAATDQLVRVHAGLQRSRGPETPVTPRRWKHSAPRRWASTEPGSGDPGDTARIPVTVAMGLASTEPGSGDPGDSPRRSRSPFPRRFNGAGVRRPR